MKIKFTNHALIRAKERGITKKFLLQAIRFPDKVDISSQDRNRLLLKKLYFNNKLQADHLLMIIGEKSKYGFKLITIIDTSKITKYY